MSAGIMLAKKVGDQVKLGEPLCTIYTNKDKEIWKPIIEEIVGAYEIVDEYVPAQTVIKEVIG